jgi:hypothetical protein
MNYNVDFATFISQVIVPLSSQSQGSSSQVQQQQQQHQSRQQQYMSKPFNASQVNSNNTNSSNSPLTGQNYVLAQMTKYQRNNSVNLLNLSTQKLVSNQAGYYNNNFMSTGVIRPKGSLLKQKDFFGNDLENSKNSFANQILCRGVSQTAKLSLLLILLISAYVIVV